MNKEILIRVLKKHTMGMFAENWYENTVNEMFNESNKKNKGYVYFVKFKSSNAIKIGKSFDVIKRVNELRNGHQDDMILLGYIYSEDYGKLENESHKKFNEKRISGEWFNVSLIDVIDYIKSLNGIVVNSYVGKKLIVVDGALLSTHKIIEGAIKSNEDLILFDIFNSLDRGVRLTKDAIIERLPIEMAKNISKKRITSSLRKYAQIKEIKYFDGNSNGMRWFMLS